VYPRNNVSPARSRVARDYLPTSTGILSHVLSFFLFPVAFVSSPSTLDTPVYLFRPYLKVPIMPFSAKSFHPNMMTEIFFLDQFLKCLLSSCGICFYFLRHILAHQNFAGVCNLHCGRHLNTPSARLCLCQRSQHGLRCLCTFVSTFSLSLLRQRQHLQETRTFPYSQPIQHCSRPQSTLSHTTPSSSRSPSATLSTPAHTSQIEKNGQAPQIVMLVITRKNKNRRLPHLLYEHSRA